MDEDIEQLVVSVRADTRAFAGDVETMKAQLDGPLTEGVDRAGKSIETALSKAIRTGKFGFDDLRKLALSVLADIASAAGNTSFAAAGSSGSTGGLLTLATNALGSILGLPGRATGGNVAPGSAYMVGEHGPELFVPTSAGRVENPAAGRTPINVTINMNAPADGRMDMARTGNQLARVMRRTLERAGN